MGMKVCIQLKLICDWGDSLGTLYYKMFMLQFVVLVAEKSNIPSNNISVDIRMQQCMKLQGNTRTFNC